MVASESKAQALPQGTTLAAGCFRSSEKNTETQDSLHWSCVNRVHGPLVNGSNQETKVTHKRKEETWERELQDWVVAERVGSVLQKAAVSRVWWNTRCPSYWEQWDKIYWVLKWETSLWDIARPCLRNDYASDNMQHHQGFGPGNPQERKTMVMRILEWKPVSIRGCILELCWGRS